MHEHKFKIKTWNSRKISFNLIFSIRTPCRKLTRAWSVQEVEAAIIHCLWPLNLPIYKGVAWYDIDNLMSRRQIVIINSKPYIYLFMFRPFWWAQSYLTYIPTLHILIQSEHAECINQITVRNYGWRYIRDKSDNMIHRIDRPLWSLFLRYSTNYCHCPRIWFHIPARLHIPLSNIPPRSARLHFPVAFKHLTENFNLPRTYPFEL